MVLALLLLAVPALAQSVSVTTTAGPSLITSSTLKLAATYAGSSFTTDFDFFTADDPTGGYVDYVSLAEATSSNLISVQNNGSFVMRADSSNVAAGRGRKSIRIVSQKKFADGVYILDMNHMPVGCGTWPAFWTVTKDGWPVGGEIDVIEGANFPPAKNGAAYNATTGYLPPTTPINKNVASLHLSENCVLDKNDYQTGTTQATFCDAYFEGNIGCGVAMGANTTYGVDSFGAGVNQNGGGWYAMWRDVANSGGVYIYYWPRNSKNVPDDVRNPSTATTNVANWGQPGANLSVPACQRDFNNHVIVFNLAFCGDYAGASYSGSGCPSSCSSFVMNNPAAFAEAYWSINSLRIYTATGQAATDPSALSTGAIAGIAVGGFFAILIPLIIFWRYRVRKRRSRGLPEEEEIPQSYVFVARQNRARTGLFEGETPKGYYHDDSRHDSENSGGSEENIVQATQPEVTAPNERKKSRTSMQQREGSRKKPARRAELPPKPAARELQADVIPRADPPRGSFARPQSHLSAWSPEQSRKSSYSSGWAG